MMSGLLNLPSTLNISGYAEIFINLERPIYDRARLYAGLGYVISSSVRMEVGNMTQVFETFSSNQLQLFLFHNLNF